MLELSKVTISSDNYNKIIQIMRNYAAVSEGVSRDFISLSISKAEEIIAGCYWDLGAGQSMIEFIGRSLIQVK
jgi:hypothetical protein